MVPLKLLLLFQGRSRVNDTVNTLSLSSLMKYQLFCILYMFLCHDFKYLFLLFLIKYVCLSVYVSLYMCAEVNIRVPEARVIGSWELNSGPLVEQQGPLLLNHPEPPLSTFRYGPTISLQSVPYFQPPDTSVVGILTHFSLFLCGFYLPKVINSKSINILSKTKTPIFEILIFLKLLQLCTKLQWSLNVSLLIINSVSEDCSGGHSGARVPLPDSLCKRNYSSLTWLVVFYVIIFSHI